MPVQRYTSSTLNMPKKRKSDLSQSSRQSLSKKKARSQETSDETERRRNEQVIRQEAVRHARTPEQASYLRLQHAHYMASRRATQARREEQAQRQASLRAAETPHQAEYRRQQHSMYIADQRGSETPEQFSYSIKSELVEVKQEDLSMEDEESSNKSLLLQPAEGISCNRTAEEKEGRLVGTAQTEEVVDIPFETVYCQEIFQKVEIKVENIEDCEPDMTITSQPEEDDVFIEPEVLTYPSKKTSSHGLNSVPLEIKVENIEDCEPDMTITSQPEEDNVFIEPEVLTYPSKKTSSHGLNSVPVIMESVIGTEKKSSSRKTCAMTGCEVNQARSPGVHFFKFPVSRQEICEQWVASCGNEALGSLTKAALRAKLVCEKHFTNDSFTSTLKTRLKINAIPTTVETCSSPTTPLLEELTSLPQSLKETPFTPPVCRTESKTKSFLQDPCTPLYKMYRRVKKRRLMPKKTDSSGKQKVFKKLHMKLNSKKLKQALERRKEKPQNASSDVVLQALQSCPPEKVEIKVEVSEDYVKTIASQPEEENTVFVERQLLTYPSKKNDFRIMNLVPMKECDYPKEDVTDNQLGETEEMHIVDFSELASSSFNPLKRLDGLTDSKVSSTTSKHITRPVFKVCQLCENQCFSTYKDLMDHYKSRHHVSSVPPPAKAVTTPPTNVTFKKRFRMLKKSKDKSSSSPDGQDVFHIISLKNIPDRRRKAAREKIAALLDLIAEKDVDPQEIQLCI